MTNKIISTLSLILLLGSSSITGVSANSNSDVKALDFMSGISFDSTLNWPQLLLVKKDVSYDESKDPTLRKGTENWEESQGSFLAIPAVVVGIIALVLFFNRE